MRNRTQGCGIVGLNEPAARPKRLAIGQKYRSDGRIEREIRRGFFDAGGQIGRHFKAPRRMANGRLHQRRQIELAEARRDLAPRHQIAGHRDGLGADAIGAAFGLHVVRPLIRDRRITIRPRHRRRGGETIDHQFAAVSQPDHRRAATEDADHHRFDHGQREQRGHRGVDGIAALRHDFQRGSGSQRMIGHRHAARCGHRGFLAIKRAGGSVSPLCHELVDLPDRRCGRNVAYHAKHPRESQCDRGGAD